MPTLANPPKWTHQIQYSIGPPQEYPYAQMGNNTGYGPQGPINGFLDDNRGASLNTMCERTP